MAEYIDREKLIEGRVSNDPVRIAAMCEPAADVKPVKHGQWDEDISCVKLVPDDKGEFSKIRYYYCRCCHWGIGSEGKLSFNYCPNCGAKMGGGAEDGKN